MAGEEQGNVWPLPKFYFSVEIADIGKIPFQEVSGLDVEAQPIEYRAGDSKIFSNIKMPGLVKTGNVTVKKGVFVNDNRFWAWYDQIKMNTIKRQAVTISLLDQEANPTMVWKLGQCLADQDRRHGSEIRRQRGCGRNAGDLPRGADHREWRLIDAEPLIHPLPFPLPCASPATRPGPMPPFRRFRV